MIVYNMPIVFRKMYIYIYFSTRKMMDHYGEEKNPFFVFRQWVENIATQKQVQPIMYGKKFASDNYQKVHLYLFVHFRALCHFRRQIDTFLTS